MTGAAVSVLDRLRTWVVGDTSKRDAALDALEFAARDRLGTTAGSVSVTQDTALRHSAVWAGLRLRANLMSMMPVDTYRKVGDVQASVPASPFFAEPSGADSTWPEWMWATQFDLDRYGLTAGHISERDGTGKPRRIDLVSAADVTLRGSGSVIEEIKLGRDVFTGERLGDVYLEYQYRPAGFLVPLCPIAYAAWTIGGYLSAQKFGLDYFGSNAFPAGVLRHTSMPKLDTTVTQAAKSQFKAATQDRDIFVTGSDWEWTPADSPKAAEAFLDAKAASTVEVARYLDLPADVIDGAVAGQAITYANIGQRNVQLLVMHLGPAIVRREARLSRLLSAPRFIKLNTDAVLRMDPETRASVLNEGIRSLRVTVNEARALDNRPPLTEDEILLAERLGLTKKAASPAASPTGAIA